MIFPAARATHTQHDARPIPLLFCHLGPSDKSRSRHCRSAAPASHFFSSRSKQDCETTSAGCKSIAISRCRRAGTPGETKASTFPVQLRPARLRCPPTLPGHFGAALERKRNQRDDLQVDTTELIISLEPPPPPPPVG